MQADKGYKAALLSSLDKIGAKPDHVLFTEDDFREERHPSLRDKPYVNFSLHEEQAAKFLIELMDILQPQGIRITKKKANKSNNLFTHSEFTERVSPNQFAKTIRETIASCKDTYFFGVQINLRGHLFVISNTSHQRALEMPETLAILIAEAYHKKENR